MVSKAFAELAGQLSDSKALDKVLWGGSYLGEGIHDVTIQAVDTTNIEKDSVRLTFLSSDGKTHNETIFLLDKNGNGFGYQLRQLWSALFLDKEAIARLIAAVSTDGKAFEVLTGMKLEITLARGKGFYIKTRQDGLFVAADENGEVTDGFETAKEAADTAEANGYRRAYMRMKSPRATDTDINIAVLDKALAARNKPTIARAASV